MPLWAQPSSAARATLRGMRSAFQPMSCSARRAFFKAASSSRRASVSSCRLRSMSCAKHSPCTRAAARSSPRHAKSPRGRRQCQQRQICSPSASSTASKSPGTTRRSCRPSTPPATREALATAENRTRSSAAEASGNAPAAALPMSLGWNHNRETPSTGFTPMTTSSPPEASRTTWPCLKPPTCMQISSRTSNTAIGGFFSKLPA
mmetsp:Transcript_74769/g.206110  ORF Transcript_74769/g.206110 Transcript_74769/m.206110 type:complete len:205 (+) Transcript_74769:2822-3436(+)